MKRRGSFGAALILACAGVAWLGCGSDEAPTQASADASAEAGNGNDLFDGGSGGGSLDAGCVGTSISATKPKLDLHLMLDQSGSMTETISGGQTRWDAVVGALTNFVQQPEAAGIGFGLQYFAQPAKAVTCPTTTFCTTDTDCGGCGPCDPQFKICMNPQAVESCDAADYVTPDVEIAPLPGVVPNILASLAAHAPTTGTPTSAALQGAITHAGDWAKLPANADHVTVAVLASDGEPSACDTDASHLRQIAETAATGTPKILTFVIGVGDQIAVLDDIAAGGGTGKAHFVDSDVNAGQAFLDALNEVRVKALGCVYSIPAPNGEKPKYTEVNVSYTPSDGSAAEIFPKVRGQADCAENVDGWYYDDDAAPTKIFLCTASCSKFTAGATPKVDIVLGCQTRVR